jgi:predicted Zn-dependent protease with MMP-like domain
MATRDLDAPDWANALAPSLADLERLAEQAYARLPPHFRALCEGIVIRVEDFPDEETLDEMNCETEFDLLGLFRGIGLAQAGATPQSGQFPNMIWLYRRPLLDYWAEHEETLGHLVTHVLVHEIGHHFGLSDDDMYGIEAAAE